MKTAERIVLARERRCAGCVFYNQGSEVCRRFPHPEPQAVDYWCGEFWPALSKAEHPERWAFGDKEGP